jgi:Zn-dependent protease
VFLEPERTQFDLNFRLFRVDIRIHPFYWLVTAFLGWPTLDPKNGGPQAFVLWMVCVIVSVLVHEFGHIMMGRVFGAHGHIVLYGLGGLAVGSSALPGRWQRIAVYFAGPLAGFVLFAGVLIGQQLVDMSQVSPYVHLMVESLFFINLIWGIFNLLPIWPLDGGQISRDFLGWLLPRNGTSTALGISLVLAGLLAFHALLVTMGKDGLPLLKEIPFVRSLGGMYTVLFLAMLAFNSFQALQWESQRPWDRYDDY